MADDGPPLTEASAGAPKSEQMPDQSVGVVPETGTKLLDTPSLQDKRSKKQQARKRGRGGAAAQEEIALTAAQADHLRIVRVEGRKDPALEEKACPVVLLSKVGKAPQLQLSEDRLSVSGFKGFRTVRATHGIHRGTWYCEVSVDYLGASGHARLGWATRRAELQAPVGFDKYGFCYRDLEGSKVHQGLREPYGNAFGEGDVIGLLIHLPEGGRTCEIIDRPVARYKGNLYFVDEPEPQPETLQGSMIAFTRNGELQGVAYSDVLEGTYYPAAALYTLPKQDKPARVTFNFGPEFKHPPPQMDGIPPAQPMCGVPAFHETLAVAAAQEAAQQQQQLLQQQQRQQQQQEQEAQIQQQQQAQQQQQGTDLVNGGYAPIPGTNVFVNSNVDIQPIDSAAFMDTT